MEKIYSTDANMLGLTHEAGQLEELETPATLVTPEMGVWPWDAPGDHAFVSLTWEGGRPVAVDGVATTLVQAFRQASALAGAQGGDRARGGEPLRGDQVPVRGAGDGGAGAGLRVPPAALPRPPGARAVRPPLALPGDADLPGVLVRPGDDGRLAAVERMAGIVSAR